jgi:hypothetical protein
MTPSELIDREGEPGLAPDRFIAAIWEERHNYVKAGRIKQPHPWRVAVGGGKVSKEALVEYVKNRYYFLVNINRKDAQIIANCPIPAARRMLLRKYIDEEGQDVAGGKLGPHDGRVSCGMGPDHEERGWHVLAPQDREDLRGPGGIGAVVERQGNGPGRHPVGVGVPAGRVDDRSAIDQPARPARAVGTGQVRGLR